MDDIARAMSELATSSRSPVGAGVGAGLFGGAPASAPAAATTAAAVPSGPADAPIWLDPADEHLCNDCGTCYQELPQFFDKTTIIVDGASQIVARMKPGAVDSVEITPDIAKRITRVKATCDAEIIR